MTRRLASIPLEQPGGEKNGVGAWLMALALGVAVLVTLISTGTIVINPVAVVSVLVYVIHRLRGALFHLAVVLRRTQP